MMLKTSDHHSASCDLPALDNLISADKVNRIVQVDTWANVVWNNAEPVPDAYRRVAGN
jgi:hypothetical protein